MNYKLVWAIYRFKGITAPETAVLQVFASHASFEGGGDIYPSLSTLASCTKLSRRTIPRVLISLEAKNLIARNRHYNGSVFSNNIYSLNEELILSGRDIVTLPPLKSYPQGSDTLSLGVVTPCHQGSDTVAPGVVTQWHTNVRTECKKKRRERVSASAPALSPPRVVEASPSPVRGTAPASPPLLNPPSTALPSPSEPSKTALNAPSLNDEGVGNPGVAKEIKSLTGAIAERFAGKKPKSYWTSHQRTLDAYHEPLPEGYVPQSIPQQPSNRARDPSLSYGQAKAKYGAGGKSGARSEFSAGHASAEPILAEIRALDQVVPPADFKGRFASMRALLK